MIWPFTRVIISSTTCPVTNTGRHAVAMRNRTSFFIRFSDVRSAWALRTTNSRTQLSQWIFYYFVNSFGSYVFDADALLRQDARRNSGQPHQAHGSHIVGNQRFAGKLADRVQDRSAERLSSCWRDRPADVPLRAPSQNRGLQFLSSLHLPSTTPRETSSITAPFSKATVGASQVAWEKRPSGKPVEASSVMLVLSRSRPGVCPALV